MFQVLIAGSLARLRLSQSIVRSACNPFQVWRARPGRIRTDFLFIFLRDSDLWMWRIQRTGNPISHHPVSVLNELLLLLFLMMI